MPAIKAKTKAKRPPAAPEREDHRAFVAAIGRLLRLARAKRGMTRRQLAQASGVSERYLAQIEGGAGNPSVIMLASIAQALDVPIIELLPRSNGRTAAMAQILDVLARTPRAELPALAELIESRAAQPDQRDPPATVDRRTPRGAAFDQLGERGKLRARRAREDIENLCHRRGAPVATREQFDDWNVERLRDRCEHDHGRIALSALDLREITLGGAGCLRELAARHAALGAGNSHQAANGGDERAVILALRHGLGPLRLRFRLDRRHNRSSVHRHYSSCNIMHAVDGVNAPEIR